MRTYSPELLAFLDAGTVKLAGMIRIDLGEGPYGFIHRAAPFTYLGLEYKPLPSGIIAMSGFSCNTGTTAESFSVVLSESADNDITPEVILQIENYDYRDRKITLFDLHMHPVTGAILENPRVMQAGYINAVAHRKDKSNGHIATFSCETKKINYSRSNARLRNGEDQARRNPVDLGFQHVSSAGQQALKWGKA